MNKLNKLMKNKFIKNVMVVATGTAAAQAITFLFSPVITRIYGPESFGVVGVFTAVVNIIAPIAALTFPIAIVLPKEDRDAISLGKISVYSAAAISLLTMLLLIIFKDFIVDFLQIQIIAPFLYLIPIVILFSALEQIAEQWLIRKKLFNATAKVTFLHSLIVNSTKVGGGLLNPTAVVLVLLVVLGSGLKAFMLFFHSAKVDRSLLDGFSSKEKNNNKIKEITRKYRDFPTFRAPQVFINAVSQSLPIIMLTTFFGPAAAGFYSIGKSVLGLPSQLIAKAVGDVFYPRISDASNRGENLTKLIIKATLGLGIVGLFPFGIIILFGPWIFSFVFGVEWYTAGEYARWLALWSYFMFANQPSVKALPVLSAQSFHLKFTIVTLISRTIALALGYYFFKDDLVAVAFFSVSGAVLNIVLIILTIRISKHYNGQRRDNG